MTAVTTTKYYAEGSNIPYSSEREALAAEERCKKLDEYWKSNSSSQKLESLQGQLQAAMFVPEEIIATCSHDSLRIKSLVKVCQKFVEDNKGFLNYY